ncbi:hypothetical protein PPACK8108_LOCUS1584 [Phakopsora pachyrhizi]|uniref:Anaphase-promoting complex subunit 4 WD40 domain-containing protein n=1 Tax=Phakopsora pachyrhizi TaxID=170000 RepID=A0AAV0AHF8_PHAPC|nr:hypothetical protein PPACK8108_LOCUS1584 [Phakopsora pachyrhizi]
MVFEVNFASLSDSSSLPSIHHLSHQSCCPTMDLALLTHQSSNQSISTATTNSNKASPIGHDTISCYRLSGSTPLVWSVPLNRFLTENCSCVDLLGNHIDLNQPAVSSYDRIDDICWSPDGQCLAVTVSSSDLICLPPTMMVLSVHTGQLLNFPMVFRSDSENSRPANDPNDHQNNHLDLLNWVSLESVDPSDYQSAGKSSLNSQSSIGQSLCERLPKNLHVPSISNIETIRNHMGPVYSANRSKPSSNPYDHYPMVQLPPCLIAPRSQSIDHQPNVSSLLIVKSRSDRIHLFLNGTVYAGTSQLPSGIRLTCIRLIPQQKNDSEDLPLEIRGGICLQLVWIDSNNSVGYGTLEISPSLRPFSSSLSSAPPPSDLNLRAHPTLAISGIRSRELNEQLQLSGSIQNLLRDCLYGYFSIVKEWHVTRLCGKKWYESFEETTRSNHGEPKIFFAQMM